MDRANFHTHTVFSDGKEEAHLYVQEAINQNMGALGFSEHAPLPLNTTWSMKAEVATAYIQEIRNLKEEYQSQIEIYCGLEVDYIPGLISVDAPQIKVLDLDYTIGAVHFVDAFEDGTPWAVDSGPSVWKVGIKQIFNDDVEKAVTRYFELTREMIATAPPTIVAHLDRIKKNNVNSQYYSEQDPWYIRQIELTLEAIASSNSILEINTKSMYRSKSPDPYPSRWVVAKARELDIPVHLAADAHHPYLITGAFEEATQLLEEVGYQSVVLLKNGKWEKVPLSVKA